MALSPSSTGILEDSEVSIECVQQAFCVNIILSTDFYAAVSAR
jgi:hypothetical protein